MEGRAGQQARARYRAVLERTASQVLATLQRAPVPMPISPEPIAQALRPALIRLLLPPLIEVMGISYQTARGRLERIVRQISMTALPERWLENPLIRLIAQQLAQVVRGLAEQIALDLSESINEGLALGETMEQLMERVAQLTGEGALYRLERIVRTETTRAYNYSIVYESAPEPAIWGYRYDVVTDDRTSSVCRPLAGKVVSKAQLRYIPPLHPNCRTVLVPLIDPPPDVPEPEESDYQHIPRGWGLIPDLIAQRIANARIDDALWFSSEFWSRWERHAPRIRQICRRYARTEHDTNDLMSEVMVRAHERYHLYDPDQPFPAWVGRIARNLYLNQKARQAHEVTRERWD